MSLKKDVLELQKVATGQGWVVTRNKSNHLKWISPLGGSVFSSATPSDWRALANLKRDLKAYGFIEVTKQQRRKR